MVTDKLSYLLKRNLDVRERTKHFLKYHSELSKGAERLARWSIEYCDAILSVLSNPRERNKILRRPKAIEKIHNGLKELGLLLRYLETSSDGQAPTVFTKQFEKVIERLRPRDTLIIRPNNFYAYKAKPLRDTLVGILSNLPPTFAETIPSLKLADENILLIGFPKYEIANDLTNCLIGHELGHYIYSDFLKADKTIIKTFVRKIPNHYSVIKELKQKQKELYDDVGENYRIERLVSNWIKESFCDWFGIQFVGPSYYFAFIEHFSLVEPFYPPLKLNDIDSPESIEHSRRKEYRQFFAYLSPFIRCHLLLEFYKDYIIDTEKLQFLDKETLEKYTEINESIFSTFSDDSGIHEKLGHEENVIAYNWLKQFFCSDTFSKFKAKLATFDLFYDDQGSVPELWHLLYKQITPNAMFQDGFCQKPSDWRSILYASWLHRLTTEKKQEPNEDLYEENLSYYKTHSNFKETVGESLEVAYLHNEFLNNKQYLTPVYPPLKKRNNVRETKDLYLYKEYLSKSVHDIEDRILITPILDVNQIGPGSIDLRLGNDYILFQKATGLLKINPLERREIERELHKYQTRVRLNFGEPLYLHPGELILARTFEYIRIPDKFAADVVGRSSLGRLGPIIATAPRIQPGFKGTVTLEIVNLGNVPVVLYPCLRVAQLIISLL